jgi:hypothetical protein
MENLSNKFQHRLTCKINDSLFDCIGSVVHLNLNTLVEEDFESVMRRKLYGALVVELKFRLIHKIFNKAKKTSKEIF